MHNTKMINLPYRGDIHKSIVPFGLDGAPCSFEQVVGGSQGQFLHRTLDTYGVCAHIVAAGRLPCNSVRMKKLILASVSPWRRKILTEAGIRFTVEESGYKEDMKLPFAPRVLARRLALGKAQAVAGRHKNALVIGADTFAVFRGKLLGKPLTPARAIAMLTMLSGKTHVLLTGFSIVDSATGRHISKTVATQVRFRNLSQAEIAAYVDTGEPLKAAGAYVIQGQGARLIEKTVGDANNVAGLPLSSVKKELAKFGVKV